MTTWIATVNGFAEGWAAALFRASWQGAIAVVLVWTVCRGFPRIPARVRCWLWRLVYLKLLLALFWWRPVAELPLLPTFMAPPVTELGALPLEEPTMPMAAPTTVGVQQLAPATPPASTSWPVSSLPGSSAWLGPRIS